jgi:hypothetical protein
MLYWRKRSEVVLKAKCGLRLLAEELAHAAEFLVALIEE